MGAKEKAKGKAKQKAKEKAKEKAKVTLTTNYDKVMTKLKAVTTVEGLPIKAQTSDGCADVDQTLPLGLGHITIPGPATVKLSTSFPAVKASTKTVVTDQDGEQVSCSILHFQVTKDSDVSVRAIRQEFSNRSCFRVSSGRFCFRVSLSG